MGRSRKEISTEEIVLDLINTNSNLRKKLKSIEAAAGYSAALAVRDNPNSMTSSEEFYNAFLVQETE